jgi:phosphoribosylformylglycinamidine synthase
MLQFFKNSTEYFVVQATNLNLSAIEKLQWLFKDAELINETKLIGFFKGLRVNMISPWSTNAVEITQNMGFIT